VFGELIPSNLKKHLLQSHFIIVLARTPLKPTFFWFSVLLVALCNLDHRAPTSSGKETAVECSLAELTFCVDARYNMLCSSTSRLAF
jgi:hypothetical protein